MDCKLVFVILPVGNMDWGKCFYHKQAGFRLDTDHRAGADCRLFQLTPQGSACSLRLMRHPASGRSVQGRHLVVTDIEQAHAELAGRGVGPSDVFRLRAGPQDPGHGTGWQCRR